MANERHYEITVSASVKYLPEQSDEKAARFVFAYTITIRNTGNATAQLISRHWVITDSQGLVQEVRGLGVLNIRDMFGDTAVKKNKYLRLIVHLTRPMTEPSAHGYERLTGDSGSRHVLDLDVPLITLPVMPGRNLAVLTEAATRLHILRTKGIDPAAMFIARHSNLLERSTP